MPSVNARDVRGNLRFNSETRRGSWDNNAAVPTSATPAPQRKGLQDWGRHGLDGGPRTHSKAAAAGLFGPTKKYDSAFARATDFEGLTKPPYVHLAVDVVGGVVGNSLSPGDYKLAGTAAGVLLANYLYNRVGAADLGALGALGAVAASRSGLLDEDEEKAGGADDADDGWTPGQRPSRRYAPDPAADGEESSAAAEAAAAAEGEETLGDEIAGGLDRLFSPKVAGRLMPDEVGE